MLALCKKTTKTESEITDDKSLEKVDRKLAQIELAKHACKRGKLVKLADKICNSRVILFTTPAH